MCGVSVIFLLNWPLLSIITQQAVTPHVLGISQGRVGSNILRKINKPPQQDCPLTQAPKLLFCLAKLGFNLDSESNLNCDESQNGI